VFGHYSRDRYSIAVSSVTACSLSISLRPTCTSRSVVTSAHAGDVTDDGTVQHFQVTLTVGFRYDD